MPTAILVLLALAGAAAGLVFGRAASRALHAPGEGGKRQSAGAKARSWARKRVLRWLGRGDN